MLAELSCAELMARLRAGWQDAHSLLYKCYLDDMIREARRHLRNRVKQADSSDDVAQSALLGS
jgi:hypothetical protein